MTALDLAYKYMEVFYGGQSLETLRELLAEDMSFKGPFYEYQSAADYIESLLSDPPKDAKYKILSAFETDHAACLVYQFEKPGVSTTMCQKFEVRNGKIKEILLIFDSADFS